MFIRVALACHSVSLIIAFSPNIFTKFLVIHFVTVNPFLFTDSRSQFLLHPTMLFYCLVSEDNSLQHLFLGHLVHLTLHHHDILVSSGNHNIQISRRQLASGRVDHQLAIHTSYTNFGNRSVERNITHGNSGRCCQSCQTIRHRLGIARIQCYLHESLGMVIIREQGTQRAVYQTGYQNLVIGTSSLPASKSSRETSQRSELFFIIGQRHKVHVRTCILCRNNRSQKHRIAHLQHNSPIGLFGELSGL